MSQLVNVPDDKQRRAFLRVCAQHVEGDGVVLIERHAPDWQPTEARRGARGGVGFAMEDVWAESGVVAATVRYEADGETWRHPFVARLLDDEELGAELRGVGLRLTRVHGERDTWVEARLYSGA
jgi:hypothetical protein